MQRRKHAMRKRNYRSEASSFAIGPPPSKRRGRLKWWKMRSKPQKRCLPGRRWIHMSTGGGREIVLRGLLWGVHEMKSPIVTWLNESETAQESAMTVTIDDGHVDLVEAFLSMSDNYLQTMAMSHSKCYDIRVACTYMSDYWECENTPKERGNSASMNSKQVVNTANTLNNFTVALLSSRFYVNCTQHVRCPHLSNNFHLIAIIAWWPQISGKVFIFTMLL